MSNINKDLQDLQTITHNLPKNISFYYIFSDQIGEQILIGHHEEHSLIDVVFKLSKNLREMDVNDEKINRTRSFIYNMSLELMKEENLTVLNNIKNELSTIIEEKIENI